jgi:hypothetical protein
VFGEITKEDKIEENTEKFKKENGALYSVYNHISSSVDENGNLTGSKKNEDLGLWDFTGEDVTTALSNLAHLKSLGRYILKSKNMQLTFN